RSVAVEANARRVDEHRGRLGRALDRLDERPGRRHAAEHELAPVRARPRQPPDRGPGEVDDGVRPGDRGVRHLALGGRPPPLPRPRGLAAHEQAGLVPGALRRLPQRRADHPRTTADQDPHRPPSPSSSRVRVAYSVAVRVHGKPERVVVDTLLQIHGLRTSRGPRQVLKGLDLTLGSGEVLGLLGRNGAGKSTLVDVVSGRLRPDAGVMVLGEHDYRPQSPEAARAAGVSVIEQEFEPPVDLTVEQAVLRRLDGERGEEERRALVREALEAVGVELDLGTLVGSLDPAEQALVEVARVVAEQPRLVVVDEASVSLDDREIAHVHAGVRVLRERGCGVVYIAHRLDELHAIADRVAVVRDGVAADSIPTRGSTPADLAFARLRHEVEELPPRPARERGEATLRVRGLRTENVVDLDLDIDAGE